MNGLPRVADRERPSNAMRVGYITTYDVFDRSRWPATSTGLFTAGYHIAKELTAYDLELAPLGPLDKPHVSKANVFKKRLYRRFLKRRFHAWAAPSYLESYARQLEDRIDRTKPDVLLCPENVRPIAYLRSAKPLVLWTDATLASLIDFYPWLTNLCAETRRQVFTLERAALERCTVVVYPSEWAAESAVRTYAVPESKIRVIPWSADINARRTPEEVEAWIQSRPPEPCRLLFVGVDWRRKGGETALEAARLLNARGTRTELTVVGCHPPSAPPDFCRALGFIDKTTPAGKQQFENLLASAHFVILPTMADCSPLAVVEANSFGTPTLVSRVGGTSSIVRNDQNGRLFDVNAGAECYAEYIAGIMSEPDRYWTLARSSFEEYSTRLTWASSCRRLYDILQQVA